MHASISTLQMRKLKFGEVRRFVQGRPDTRLWAQDVNPSDSLVHTARHHNILREASGRENLAGNLRVKKESQVAQIRAATQWLKVAGVPCGGEPGPAIERALGQGHWR